jgi:hypothetical protein
MTDLPAVGCTTTFSPAFSLSTLATAEADVIERPRLHSGKAEGLRSGDARTKHKGREPHREGGGTKCPNVNTDHCYPPS